MAMYRPSSAGGFAAAGASVSGTELGSVVALMLGCASPSGSASAYMLVLRPCSQETCNLREGAYETLQSTALEYFQDLQSHKECCEDQIPLTHFLPVCMPGEVHTNCAKGQPQWGECRLEN